MFSEEVVIRALERTSFEQAGLQWIDESRRILDQRRHGDREQWMAAIASLPLVNRTRPTLDQDRVRVDLEGADTGAIRSAFQALHPWRKGPFDIGGVVVDSEWRSDWKWRRISERISDLRGRKVLDVGSGNGYYLFRMLGNGAKLAMGIDPTQLFLAQFAAVNHFVNTDRAFVLPMKSDELNTDSIPDANRFDTVFSMGIYYHRKQPTEHLQELHDFLRPGGELVLETLVIDGDEDTELNPDSRYAQMRNVWSLPSVPRLVRLLGESGFADVRLIDLTATTTAEQRATEWMRFDSLANFLDPNDPTRTVEGYPAPLRAGITAVRRC